MENEFTHKQSSLCPIVEKRFQTCLFTLYNVSTCKGNYKVLDKSIKETVLLLAAKVLLFSLIKVGGGQLHTCHCKILVHRELFRLQNLLVSVV